MKKLIFLLIAIVMVAACKSPSKVTQQTATPGKVKIEAKMAAPNTLSQAEMDEGWQLLFDGKSTAHWRGYNKPDFPKGWEVVDGTIHVIGSGRGEAGSGGDIITREKFKNFELSLEWMVDTGANSGIFYLAREVEGEPIWKSSPEMQVLDNFNHPDAKLGIKGNRQAGALYDLIPAVPQNFKGPMQWTPVRIMVYKGTVVHYMNGEKVLEYHLWTDDWKAMCAKSKFKDYPLFIDTAEEGYIGLQDHGDDVWFRNIKIKILR
ncbi:MAG: DUF1080 domain-containing protein [Bacteroidales bacterium]|nr:DUF1080 domain-containing protein [Lentimicrobiaceae bacterium]MDD5693794.1 DUF1080 domain-containing protein [Bacteroidales bacterium]